MTNKGINLFTSSFDLMKKFIVNIVGFVSLCTLLSLTIYSIFLLRENPSIDRYYKSFTSIHDGSIITGTSRGRYALNLEDSSFKNFCFTRSISPYNDSYTNFLIHVIEQKKGATSILTVSPISIGADQDLDFFSKFNFKRSDFKKINFNYLIHQRITPIKVLEWNIKELTRKITFGEDYSKDNRDSSKDTLKLARQVDNYPIPEELNSHRIENLEKLIRHFQKTSKVFLVRLPVPQKMYTKENYLHPSFNDLVDSISQRYGVKYLDMNNFKFYPDLIFYDSHHVNLKETKRVSRSLLDTIMQIKEWN